MVWWLDAELFEQHRHVTSGFNVVERVREDAVAVDDEGRADDALDLFAIHVLGSERAIRLEGFLALVTEQQERKAFVGGELLEVLAWVRRNTDDDVVLTREGGHVIAEVARLSGAAGGHRLGVKVDDDVLAREIRERVVGARCVGESECGGFVAGVKCHGFRLHQPKLSVSQ